MEKVKKRQLQQERVSLICDAYFVWKQKLSF